jgi:hypothetical protein
MQPSDKEKRELPHLRSFIEKAGPMEKATMRYLARMLSAEQLRPVDDALGRLCGTKKPKDGKG